MNGSNVSRSLDTWLKANANASTPIINHDDDHEDNENYDDDQHEHDHGNGDNDDYEHEDDYDRGNYDTHDNDNDNYDTNTMVTPASIPIKKASTTGVSSSRVSSIPVGSRVSRPVLSLQVQSLAPPSRIPVPRSPTSSASTVPSSLRSPTNGTATTATTIMAVTANVGASSSSALSTASSSSIIASSASTPTRASQNSHYVASAAPSAPMTRTSSATPHVIQSINATTTGHTHGQQHALPSVSSTSSPMHASSASASSMTNGSQTKKLGDPMPPMRSLPSADRRAHDNRRQLMAKLQHVADNQHSSDDDSSHYGDHTGHGDDLERDDNYEQRSVTSSGQNSVASGSSHGRAAAAAPTNAGGNGNGNDSNDIHSDGNTGPTIEVSPIANPVELFDIPEASFDESSIASTSRGIGTNGHVTTGTLISSSTHGGTGTGTGTGNMNGTATVSLYSAPLSSRSNTNRGNGNGNADTPTPPISVPSIVPPISLTTVSSSLPPPPPFPASLLAPSVSGGDDSGHTPNNGGGNSVQRAVADEIAERMRHEQQFQRTYEQQRIPLARDEPVVHHVTATPASPSVASSIPIMTHGSRAAPVTKSPVPAVPKSSPSPPSLIPSVDGTVNTAAAISHHHKRQLSLLDEQRRIALQAEAAAAATAAHAQRLADERDTRDRQRERAIRQQYEVDIARIQQEVAQLRIAHEQLHQDSVIEREKLAGAGRRERAEDKQLISRLKAELAHSNFLASAREQEVAQVKDQYGKLRTQFKQANAMVTKLKARAVAAESAAMISPPAAAAKKGTAASAKLNATPSHGQGQGQHGAPPIGLPMSLPPLSAENDARLRQVAEHPPAPAGQRHREAWNNDAQAGGAPIPKIPASLAILWPGEEPSTDGISHDTVESLRQKLDIVTQQMLVFRRAYELVQTTAVAKKAPTASSRPTPDHSAPPTSKMSSKQNEQQKLLRDEIDRLTMENRRLERTIESLANGLPVAGAPPGSAEAQLIESQANEIKQLKAQAKKDKAAHHKALVTATAAATAAATATNNDNGHGAGGKDVWRQRWQELERETKQLRRTLIAHGISPLANQQGKWADADAPPTKHVSPVRASAVVATPMANLDAKDDQVTPADGTTNGGGGNDALAQEVSSLQTKLRELSTRREAERHRARHDLELAHKQIEEQRVAIARKEKLISQFRSTLERLKRGGVGHGPQSALASPHRGNDDHEGDEQKSVDDSHHLPAIPSATNGQGNRRATDHPRGHGGNNGQQQSLGVVLPSLDASRARSAPLPANHPQNGTSSHNGGIALASHDTWMKPLVGPPPLSADELWTRYMPSFVGLCKSQLEGAINHHSVHALQSLFDCQQSYFDMVADKLIERYPDTLNCTSSFERFLKTKLVKWVPYRLEQIRRAVTAVIPSIAHYRHTATNDDDEQHHGGGEVSLTDASQSKVEELVLIHVLKYHRHIAYFAFSERTLAAIAREIIFIYNHLGAEHQSALPSWFRAYVPDPERLRAPAVMVSTHTHHRDDDDHDTDSLDVPLGSMAGISSLSPSPAPHHPANADRLHDHASSLFHPSLVAAPYPSVPSHVPASPTTSSSASSDESGVTSPANTNNTNNNNGNNMTIAGARDIVVSPSPVISSPRPTPARPYSPNVSILSPLPSYPQPSSTTTGGAAEDDSYAADFEDDIPSASSRKKVSSSGGTNNKNTLASPRLPPLSAVTAPLTVTSVTSTPRSNRDWTAPPLPSSSPVTATSATTVPDTVVSTSAIDSSPMSSRVVSKLDFAATLSSALSAGPRSSRTTADHDAAAPASNESSTNNDNNDGGPVLQHMRRASIASGRRRPSRLSGGTADQIFAAHTSPRSGTTTMLQHHVSPSPATTRPTDETVAPSAATAVSPPLDASSSNGATSPPLLPSTTSVASSLNRASSLSPPIGAYSPPPPAVTAIRTDSSLIPFELASSPVGMAAAALLSSPRYGVSSPAGHRSNGSHGSGGGTASGNASPLAGAAAGSSFAGISTLSGSMDIAMSPRERRERARADREREREQRARAATTATATTVAAGDRPPTSGTRLTRIDSGSALNLPPSSPANSGSSVPSTGMSSLIFAGLESPRVTTGVNAFPVSSTPTSASSGTGTPSERRERARAERERERARQREEAAAAERQREKERLERREQEAKARRDRRERNYSNTSTQSHQSNTSNNSNTNSNSNADSHDAISTNESRPVSSSSVISTRTPAPPLVVAATTITTPTPTAAAMIASVVPAASSSTPSSSMVGETRSVSFAASTNDHDGSQSIVPAAPRTQSLSTHTREILADDDDAFDWSDEEPIDTTTPVTATATATNAATSTSTTAVTAATNPSIVATTPVTTALSAPTTITSDAVPKPASSSSVATPADDTHVDDHGNGHEIANMDIPLQAVEMQRTVSKELRNEAADDFGDDFGFDDDDGVIPIDEHTSPLLTNRTLAHPASSPLSSLPASPAVPSAVTIPPPIASSSPLLTVASAAGRRVTATNGSTHTSSSLRNTHDLGATTQSLADSVFGDELDTSH